MRKKYALGICICALLSVFFYAPYGLRLRSSDAGIFRAGMSVVLGIVLAGVFAFCMFRLFARQESTLLSDRRREERIRTALRGLARRQITGRLAESALTQLDTAAEKARAFRQTIGRKFGAGSLTHSRYAEMLPQSLETVLNNTDALCERIRTFDEKEYISLSAQISTGTYRDDGIDDTLQEDRLLLLSEKLRDIERILNANEQLLLHLDKCTREVAALGDAAGDKENERILDEIRRLIETTKYYS